MENTYIVRLRDIPEHVKVVAEVMREQHALSYGVQCVIDETKLVNSQLSETYLMLSKNDFLGFFSLSRLNLTQLGFWSQMWSWICSIVLKRMYIYNVYIFPEYRKQGYGVKMIKHAIERCMKMIYVNVVQLFTLTEELGKFYQHAGFTMIDEERDYLLYEYRT